MNIVIMMKSDCTCYLDGNNKKHMSTKKKYLKNKLYKN